uniref:Uncharacterized protein n=1 Tax=Hyaloperonospora arabidopsidis (strain Emoy2) TaxID=559515 RepID=M4C1E8_HYAAE
MIVQLAPLSDCATAVVAENKDSCNFDNRDWNLESYKRHVLSDDKRAQIVAEYDSDQVYGSKVAMAMFDARGAPFELDVDESAPWTRNSVSAASVFVFLLCLGLGLHQHRRLQNGYVPVSGTKEKALEARSSPRQREPTDRQFNREPSRRVIRFSDMASTLDVIPNEAIYDYQL